MASYVALEENSLNSLGVKAPSFDGVSSSFLETSTFVYMLLFSAIIVAAFYRYVVAGALRMQASQNSIQKSNEIIKAVTLGLLGVFSLFLILFTINKELVTGNVGLGDFNTQTGSSKGVATTPPIAANPPAPAAGAPTGGGNMWDAIRKDPVVRARLSSMNISVNKPVCSSPALTDCTTVGGLPEGTLSMLQSLRIQCGGTLQITGGTEAGHASHGPGRTPVDVGINDGTLNSCIRGFSSGPSVGDWCKSTFTNFGYVFCDENNTAAHWHIYQ
jgi:hypothetical protein